MSLASHLVLREQHIRAGQDWVPNNESWLLVRVRSGFGLWLDAPDKVREVSLEDMLVMFPSVQGTFMASRLGDVTLQTVSIDPGLLSGVLTVKECRALTAVAARTSEKLLVLPRKHPMALRFAEICQAHGENALVLRLRLLQLLAELLGDGIAIEAAVDVDYADGRARMRKLIQEMPEAELRRYSISELSKKLCCSQRHFSRLFREEVGVSLRENQKKLRLEYARHLLERSSDKIIDIALEAGYRSLSLFNVMFKERYKMTPSQWRSKSQSKKQRSPKTRMVFFACISPILFTIYSQEPEGEVRSPKFEARTLEAVSTNQSPRFRVDGYAISGNTLLSTEVLTAVLEPHMGDAVGIETIKKAVTELVLAYRERGYATVGVSLPQQQLTDGLVKVDVHEGVLTEIRVEENRFFSSNNVMRALPGLGTNVILNSKLFQAELDRANLNRDRQIYPQLQPGLEPGTSTLILKVKDRLPLHGKADVNNYNTPDTPAIRANLSLQYNNLWQREHATGFQYGFTPEETKTDHPDNTDNPLDFPLISYYNAFYRFPLGSPGSIVDRVNRQPGQFGFNEATRQFAVPPPQNTPELFVFANRSTTDTGLKGDRNRLVHDSAITQIYASEGIRDFTLTESVGFRLNWPLTQTKRQLALSWGADLKHYRARGYHTNIFTTVSTIPPANPNDPPQTVVGETISERNTGFNLTYFPMVLRADMTIPDSSGNTVLSLGGSYNLPLDSLSDADEFEIASGSDESTQSFKTLTMAIIRDQKIYNDWRAIFRVEGQLASEPLFSNEQFALGGISSVRGYQQGEVFGDSGWKLTFEPRSPAWKLFNFGQWPVMGRVNTFFDYGRGYLSDPKGRQSEQTLAGTGVGMNCTVGTMLDASATVAWALNETAFTNDGTARFYFNLSLQF